MPSSAKRNSAQLAVALLVIVILSGCTIRSISDSGYYADASRRGASASNPYYRGELNEFDLLGIDPKAAISEADIQKSIASKNRLTVRKGSALMLIQSGAMIPDDIMVKELEKYYNIAVFTGVPVEAGTPGNSYANAIRLAAAKGGYEQIVVYWGLLESGRENLVTKTVSWVPIVGWALPDETQRMRTRMKVAVVDVRSGRWDMFSPEPFEDTDASAALTRAQSDQAQVTILKEPAYKSVVDNLVKRYSR